MSSGVRVNRHGSISIGGGYGAVPPPPMRTASSPAPAAASDLMDRLASLEEVMREIDMGALSPTPATSYLGPPPAKPTRGVATSFDDVQSGIEQDLMAEIDALARSVPPSAAPIAPQFSSQQQQQSALPSTVAESAARLETLLNEGSMGGDDGGRFYAAEQQPRSSPPVPPRVRVSRNGSVAINLGPPPMPPPSTLPPSMSEAALSAERAALIDMQRETAAARAAAASAGSGSGAAEPQKFDAAALLTEEQQIEALPPRYRADVQALGDLRDLLQMEDGESLGGTPRRKMSGRRPASHTRRGGSSTTRPPASGVSRSTRERRHVRARPQNVAKPIVREYRSAESVAKAPRGRARGARQLETELLGVEADLSLAQTRRDNLDTAVAEEKRILFNKLVQLKNLRTHIEELKDALDRVRGEVAEVPSEIQMPYFDGSMPPAKDANYYQQRPAGASYPRLDVAPPPPPGSLPLPRTQPAPAFGSGSSATDASISYGMEQLARSNARLERANAEFAALRGGTSVVGGGGDGGGRGATPAPMGYGAIETPSSPWAQRVQNDLVQSRNEEIEQAHARSAAANVHVNRSGSVYIR